MTALSAEASRKERNIQGKCVGRYPVGTGNTIYKGSLVVYMETTGRALAGTAAVTRSFLGVAEETATGNTGGTVSVDVAWGHEVLIDANAAATAAYVCANVAVADDNQVTTASDAGTAGVQVLVGEAIQIEGGDIWVALRQYTTKAV